MSNSTTLDPKSIYPILRKMVSSFIYAYSENNNGDWKSKALKMKYLYSETDSKGVPTDKDMAPLLGVTSESVRQIKNIPTDYCVDLINQKNDALLSFKNGIGHIEVKEILMGKFGFEDDEKTLRFFLDGLNYSLTEQKGTGNYCIDDAYYGSGLKGILKDVIPVIKKLLKANPVPLKMEDVLMAFKSQGNDVLRCGFARDLMGSDSNTFVLEEIDGEKYVSLRWDSLSETGRKVRILYDYALEKGFDSFMTRELLIKEYNRRAYLFDGVDKIPENRSVPSDDHIQRGGNGRYRYIGNATKKKEQVDLKTELLKQVAVNEGIITFDALRKFVDDNGWRYSDVTIRMYLAEDCVTARKTGGDRTLYFIMKECWEDYKTQGYKFARGSNSSTRPVAKKAQPAYKIAIIERALSLLRGAPGHSMTKKELYNAVVDLYPGESKNNIYKIFDEVPSIRKTGSGKGACYKLNSPTKER